MKDEIIDLTVLDQKINALVYRAGYYLQTYRAIDALNVLAEAHRMMDGQEVHWRVRTAVLKNTGQAYIQQGQLEKGLACFAQSYDIIEDGDEKAATAGHLAGYFLRDGRLDEAMKWADKAMETATEPDLKAGPYQIKGGIAAEEGDYPKAIELLNKAAAYAEDSHCLTDLATIISDMATVFMSMGRLETALSEMFRAERYAKESRNLDLMFRFVVRRAKLMYKMGKDEEAKALIMTLDEQKN
ncbi:MAG: tetratricopeptide repeat protein [Aeriscardovia sp.]|nr:tetratricopeptide repeat protein [Aeriscardovia sp.]